MFLVRSGKSITGGQTLSHILFKNSDRLSVPAVTLLLLLTGAVFLCGLKYEEILQKDEYIVDIM